MKEGGLYSVIIAISVWYAYNDVRGKPLTDCDQKANEHKRYHYAGGQKK